MLESRGARCSPGEWTQQGESSQIEAQDCGSRTSLVVQWLRLHTPNTGDSVRTLVREPEFHMPQQRVHVLQLRPSIAKYINLPKKRLWSPRTMVSHPQSSRVEGRESRAERFLGANYTLESPGGKMDLKILT